MQDDIFIKLVEAVEAEGGELLARTHFPTPIIYIHEDARGRRRQAPVDGTGCGQDALLKIGWDDHRPDREGNPTGNVVIRRQGTFCAIDDMMQLWPRYATQVFGAEEEEDEA